MLVDVGVKVIFGVTLVVVPEVGLQKANLVEGPFGQARMPVGEFFRIRKLADHGFDPPGLPFEVSWGAHVAGLRRGQDPDAVAWLESHGPPQRRSVSAALSSISSVVRISFSMRSFSVAATQRS